jgi:hypothetical protein
MNQKLLLTLLVLSAIIAITQAGPRSPKHEKPRNGSSSQEGSKPPKPTYNGSIFHLEGKNPSRHGGNKTINLVRNILNKGFLCISYKHNNILYT